MRSVTRAYMVFWLVAAAAFIFLLWNSWQTWLQNGEPAIVTGYTLAGLMVFLGLFNSRKKLSMVPLGRGAYWTAAHAVFGTLTLGLFWVHTGSFWPSGAYEQLFALFFYLVSLSGILGYWMQKVIPRRLTENGLEVIWERIPNEVAEIRGKAEAIVEEAAEKAASDTLARYYTETLAWYFRRPRFLTSHFVGFQTGRAYIRREFTAIARYLDDTERQYLGQLEDLAQIKNRLDFAYAVNGMAKLWLLFHVPMAVGVLLLMIWHIILVHVYLL
ncbi:MAG: hypothetical protein ACMVY4_04760 [Minwuia sp.]|uniref:hypothetical protein n=1 Tax=Minwuia sp. TaxID=2493630 RepID=UPI003A8577E7